MTKRRTTQHMVVKMARQHPDAPTTTACIWATGTATIEEVAQRLHCWAGPTYENQIVYATSPTAHLEVPKTLCTTLGTPLEFLDGGPNQCPLGDDNTITLADPINPNTCLPPQDLTALSALVAANTADITNLEAFDATAGQPNGLATLDGTGNVPLSQLGNTPGGVGAVASVNGQTGVVLLSAPDVGAATTVHTHPESEVINLTTDLAAKATDTAVVHLTGAETIAGIKTFNSLPVIPLTPSSPNQAASKSYVDSIPSAVTSVNAQTGAVVLDNTDVGAAATVHTHTQAQVTNLVTDLAGKAADSAVVHNTGTEAVAGVKTFSSSPVVPLTPTTSTQAASKGYVDSITAPVTSVNTQTGAVVLSNTDVGAAATVHTHTEAQVTGLVADLAAKAADNTVVHLTGSETITGQKTFAPPTHTDQSITITRSATVNPTTSADVMAVLYKGARAGWFNEWGGVRVRVPSLADLGYSDSALKLFEQDAGGNDGIQIYAPSDTTTPSIRSRGGVLYANNLLESAWTAITIDSPQTASKFTANTNGTNNTNSPQVRIYNGGKMAELRGRINSVVTGGVTDEIIATTLPTSITLGSGTMSAVPLRDRGFTAMGSGGGIRLLLRINGNIQMLGSANTQPYIMLDGITFSLEL